VTRLSEPAAEFGEHIEVLDVSRLFSGRTAPPSNAVAVPRRATTSCQLIAPAGSSA
jgi:hypothetical protein